MAENKYWAVSRRGRSIHLLMEEALFDLVA